MNLFQIVSVILIGVSSLGLISSFGKRRLKPSGLVFWLGLWLTGLVVILFPSLTVRVAHLFGIQRGTDVVIYSAVLFVYLLAYRLWQKLRNLEEAIGKIVGELASRDDPSGEAKRTSLGEKDGRSGENVREPGGNSPR